MRWVLYGSLVKPLLQLPGPSLLAPLPRPSPSPLAPLPLPRPLRSAHLVVWDDAVQWVLYGPLVKPPLQLPGPSPSPPPLPGPSPSPPPRTPLIPPPPPAVSPPCSLRRRCAVSSLWASCQAAAAAPRPLPPCPSPAPLCPSPTPCGQPTL